VSLSYVRYHSGNALKVKVHQIDLVDRAFITTASILRKEPKCEHVISRCFPCAASISGLDKLWSISQIIIVTRVFDEFGLSKHF
jgi:hypothetical protein